MNTILEVLPVIVSICVAEPGVYEVWLSLPDAQWKATIRESRSEPEELVSRLLLRTRDRAAAVDLVAGVLETWR